MLLEELIEALNHHNDNCKTHGINCICMDMWVIKLRQYINQHPEHKDRLRYIFNSAGRF